MFGLNALLLIVSLGLTLASAKVAKAGLLGDLVEGWGFLGQKVCYDLSDGKWCPDPQRHQQELEKKKAELRQVAAAKWTEYLHKLEYSRESLAPHFEKVKGDVENYLEAAEAITKETVRCVAHLEEAMVCFEGAQSCDGIVKDTIRHCQSASTALNNTRNELPRGDEFTDFHNSVRDAMNEVEQIPALLLQSQRQREATQRASRLRGNLQARADRILCEVSAPARIAALKSRLSKLGDQLRNSEAKDFAARYWQLFVFRSDATLLAAELHQCVDQRTGVERILSEVSVLEAKTTGEVVRKFCGHEHISHQAEIIETQTSDCSEYLVSLDELMANR
ncbi:hypothetical protein [uncultured Roseobacter sp.]|uniref:hypothetical protein n=1 Tax=uncultured Roseobacter sp. TaxID=114847 RepID=UPI0026347B46|nr:hypothetical protein [uncultured Roseobacter sp.]